MLEVLDVGVGFGEIYGVNGAKALRAFTAGISGPLLPNIRRLSIGREWVVAILSSHKDKLPPVEEIRCLPDTSSSFMEKFAPLLSRFALLRRLNFYPDNLLGDLTLLGKHVPQLVWIENCTSAGTVFDTELKILNWREKPPRQFVSAKIYRYISLFS